MAGGLAGLAGVMASAAPAAAAVGEPTRPLDPESLRLLVGEYPNGPVVLEDGSTVVEFRLIRIEAFLAASDWDPRDAPTEHWRFDVTYSGPDPDGIVTRRPVEYWKGFWPHQNNADGAPKNVAQFVHRAAQVQNGTHTVTVKVRGNESGIIAERSQSFTVNL